MSADLSVVICSLNGVAGVDRCLAMLAKQETSALLEIIVVDDGSSDDTSRIAAEHGAVVIRHPVNRGIAAARNSGLDAATAPIIAYLDDDCEPTPGWADGLLAGYAPGVAGVGGPILPHDTAGLILGFLERHNPLLPQELSLAVSHNLVYRFGLYLRRQWRMPPEACQRDVYALVGANMSFRREVLLAVGGFDERFRFGGEESDLCLRLLSHQPQGRLVYVVNATIKHHFRPTLHDVFRRSRAYGIGSARLYRKWPEVGPTVFPAPFGILALLVLSPLVPWFALAAAAVPLVLYPQGLRAAVRERKLSPLLDGYLQFGQEVFEDVGFAQGLWKFRHLVSEPAEKSRAIVRRNSPEERVL